MFQDDDRLDLPRRTTPSWRARSTSCARSASTASASPSSWRAIAPGNEQDEPAGFDATDPAQYPDGRVGELRPRRAPRPRARDRRELQRHRARARLGDADRPSARTSTPSTRPTRPSSAASSRAVAHAATRDGRLLVALQRAQPGGVAEPAVGAPRRRRGRRPRRACTASWSTRRGPRCRRPATATTRSSSARPRRRACGRTAARRARSTRCASCAACTASTTTCCCSAAATADAHGCPTSDAASAFPREHPGAVRGHRLRAPPVRADLRAGHEADVAATGRRWGTCRRCQSLPAAAARRATARSGGAAALPDRVRLPDQPARPRRRHAARSRPRTSPRPSTSRSATRACATLAQFLLFDGGEPVDAHVPDRAADGGRPREARAARLPLPDPRRPRRGRQDARVGPRAARAPTARGRATRSSSAAAASKRWRRVATAAARAAGYVSAGR